MRIVGALDVHRSQIAFRWQDMETGEVRRGQIAPAARKPVREWLTDFEPVDAHFALEGTTGWRFVTEEIERAGFTAHLAEPAETSRARPQAAGQDRPCRLRSHVQAAHRGPSAGELDPAGAHLGAAGTGEVAQDSGRPAHRVATAHARAAVPPRRAARAQRCESASTTPGHASRSRASSADAPITSLVPHGACGATPDV